MSPTPAEDGAVAIFLDRKHKDICCSFLYRYFNQDKTNRLKLLQIESD